MVIEIGGNLFWCILISVGLFMGCLDWTINNWCRVWFEVNKKGE